MHEYIDLTRLMTVLELYGADKAVAGSLGREAYDQLRNGCIFRIGEKVFLKEDDDPNAFSEGVVVAYMVHPPHFIIGSGDDRNKLPKDKNLYAVFAPKLVARGELPAGGRIVAWKKKSKEAPKK